MSEENETFPFVFENEIVRWPTPGTPGSASLKSALPEKTEFPGKISRVDGRVPREARRFDQEWSRVDFAFLPGPGD